MIAKTRLNISQQQLIDFCRRHHIRKLSLFGSILRTDFSPDSDIDFLVEFEPDAIPGLFEVAGMEIELSDMLGRKVDMRTPEDLSQYFRQDVLDSAELQYEKR
ncbi:MAG: nucleotidyltransferase family protein [Anaerolineaceae bacterium]|nr:nucleotidyltransferase family protein [Anaerolineaceae bacterium]